MKAKGKTGASVTEPDATPGAPSVYPIGLSDSDIEAYEELARIQTELGDEEGKVILKRRNAKGQLGALGVMAAVDFSMERIIQDWGGGRYVAVFFKGPSKLGQISFDVDESIPVRVPKAITEEKTPPSTPAAVPGPVTDDPRIAALERSIQSQNDLMKTLITAMVAKQGDGNALEVGMKIAEMVTGRTPAPERPSFADLKDIFLAGIEAKQAAEGGGEDDGYGPVIKAFAGPIAKVLDHAMGGERRPTMAGSIPMRTVAPQSAQPAPPQLPPGQAWLVHLQPHLSTLLGWAKAGKDPELYAEVILDNIEPGAQMEIAQAAQDPAFTEKTLAALPMFVPYSAWATAVLTNIKELLTAPPEEEGGGGSTHE